MSNEGTVSPGDVSLGTLHLMGNYVQDNAGTLSIAIGSLVFYDNLQVSGTANLDGTLSVLLDGYTGHAGDVFTIVMSSGLTGNFSTIHLPSLSDGLFFTESTDMDNVYLTVNMVPEPSTWFAAFLTAGVLLWSIPRRVSPAGPPISK